MGQRVWRWRNREIIHCHHQNDSCVKMGSDESNFNVSLIVMDKVTRQCPQTTPFLKRKENRSGIEPRPFCLSALPLGQTSSQNLCPDSISLIKEVGGVLHALRAAQDISVWKWRRMKGPGARGGQMTGWDTKSTHYFDPHKAPCLLAPWPPISSPSGTPLAAGPACRPDRRGDEYIGGGHRVPGPLPDTPRWPQCRLSAAPSPRLGQCLL